jgi:hypothetical protein
MKKAFSTSKSFEYKLKISSNRVVTLDNATKKLDSGSRSIKFPGSQENPTTKMPKGIKDHMLMPKDMIMCLTLKKVEIQSNAWHIKFAFNLFRSLYKEFKIKNHPAISRKHSNPYIAKKPTGNKKIIGNILLNGKYKILKYKYFFFWQKAFQKRLELKIICMNKFFKIFSKRAFRNFKTLCKKASRGPVTPQKPLAKTIETYKKLFKPLGLCLGSTIFGYNWDLKAFAFKEICLHSKIAKNLKILHQGLVLIFTTIKYKTFDSLEYAFKALVRLKSNRNRLKSFLSLIESIHETINNKKNHLKRTAFNLLKEINCIHNEIKSSSRFLHAPKSMTSRYDSNSKSSSQSLIKKHSAPKNPSLVSIKLEYLIKKSYIKKIAYAFM